MLELPPMIMEDSPDDRTSVGIRRHDGNGANFTCLRYLPVPELTLIRYDGFPGWRLALGQESTDETSQGFGLARFRIEQSVAIWREHSGENVTGIPDPHWYE